MQTIFSTTKTMTPKKRGRKPLSDKKRPITVFIPTSHIRELGGDEKVKLLIKKIFENAMGNI